MRPDGGRSGDVRTQDVGALVGVAASTGDWETNPSCPGASQSQPGRVRAVSPVRPHLARGETNDAAMASGARNRRDQEGARMLLLTRGTGERSGAKDPGTRPPGGLRPGGRNNSIIPSRERTTDDGAREDAHRQRKLALELPHGASHAPRSLLPMGARTTASRTAEPVRRRDHVLRPLPLAASPKQEPAAGPDE